LSAQFARESAMLKGLLFLLCPIFHCHKIKDGGYNNYEHEQGFAHPKYACTAGYILVGMVI